MRFAVIAFVLLAAAGLVLPGPGGAAFVAAQDAGRPSASLAAVSQEAPATLPPGRPDEASAERSALALRAFAHDLLALLRAALGQDGRAALGQDGRAAGRPAAAAASLAAAASPPGHERSVGVGLFDAALGSELAPMQQAAALDTGLVAFASAFLGTGQRPTRVPGGVLQPAAGEPALPGFRASSAVGADGILSGFLAGLEP